MKNYILRDKKTKKWARFEVDVDTFLGTHYDGETNYAESEQEYSIILGDNGAIWSTNDVAVAFTVLEKQTNGVVEYSPKNTIKTQLEVYCLEDAKVIKNDYCVLKIPKNAYAIGTDSIMEVVNPKVMFGKESSVKGGYYIPLTEENDIKKVRRISKKAAPFILSGREIKLHSILELDFPVNKKFKTNRYALISYERGL